MSRAVRCAVLVGVLLSCAARGSAASAARPAVSPRIVGVTVDDLRRLPAVLDSLRALPRRPWVRVVFDVDSSRPADPGPYVRAVRRLAAVGSVLGELIDSSDLRRLTTAQVAARAAAFLRGLGRSVAVWEVGNEVNGDWAGAPADVASKVQIAYDTLRRRGGRTALTLYENAGCGDGPGELSPVAWAKRFLATRVRFGLDDVFLSFYESQCAGQRPSPLEWRRRFLALHRVFPAARLGFGEIGMPEPATPSTRPAAAAIIAYYYRLRVRLPFYIGGGFYWYFAEDMVPRANSPLWTSLAQAWGAVRMRRAAAGRTSAGPAPPPSHAGFSYQLGGPFRVGAGVGVVDRDWHVAPAPGAYGICYLNGYQAQPEELGWWRARHPSLLLRRNGRRVIDQGWNEQLLDTSTAVKRRAIATIVAGWIRTCARAGYRAVEPDNLDSFTRSRGALTVADNLALARLLIASAHAAGLAIAQKNAAELAGAGHRLGFDFAIAEECQPYAECNRYLNAYGTRVIEIEYPNDGGQRNFDQACRLRGDRIAIVYRDRNVTPAGQPGFLERRCPQTVAAGSDPPNAAPSHSYPWHTHIVSTTFWVGEIFDPSASDGSQVYSTYDSQWERHYGGCDGVVRSGRCETERRVPHHNFFPSSMKPRENPFYLDLPFDDLNDPTAFAARGRLIPWAHDPGYRVHIHDPGFSLMKNRWVQIVGPNGHTCYGQIEDAGPGRYHDSRYVFGRDDRRPTNRRYNGAGMDVSPALNGCLGFADINGEDDRVAWRFVERPAVTPGPWLRIITTSGVTP